MIKFPLKRLNWLAFKLHNLVYFFHRIDRKKLFGVMVWPGCELPFRHGQHNSKWNGPARAYKTFIVLWICTQWFVLRALNQFNELPLAWALFIKVLTRLCVHQKRKYKNDNNDGNSSSSSSYSGGDDTEEKEEKERKKSMDKSNYIILYSHPALSSPFIYTYTHMYYI